jgi:hypothetical protein
LVLFKAHGKRFIMLRMCKFVIIFICLRLPAQMFKQMYTPFSPNMPNLCVAFFNEANKLLDEETQPHTLTTVAALQLLCLSCCMLGFWDDASTYVRRGVQIGTRMGLFGVQSTCESANAWLADHEDWSRAASYTAWGVYTWVVYVSFGLTRCFITAVTNKDEL